jgi:hypothetical protein
MLKHIVMWKLKNFAEGAGKTENGRIIKSKLEGLKNTIKEIMFIEVGINVTDSGDAYDIVLYSEFKDIDDLKVYQNNPEHLRVGDFIGKVRLERKVVDYES